MSPLRAHSVYRNLDSFGRLNLLSHWHSLRLCYKALCVVESAKKELDKATQERMRLSQIYYSHNSSVVVVVAA
jgi:hypothetical protein